MEIDPTPDIAGMETGPISPVNNHNLVKTNGMSHCTSNPVVNGNDTQNGLNDRKRCLEENDTGLSSQSKKKIKASNEIGAWKPGQRFEGIEAQTGEYISGKFISRAGKAGKSNKDIYNIESCKVFSCCRNSSLG